MQTYHFLTPAHQEALLANGRASIIEESDPKPVVKLFDLWGAGTWLLTEMEEDGRAFGLCDLGMGFPELGYVDLNELASSNALIHYDIYFSAKKTLSQYLDAALVAGMIRT